MASSSTSCIVVFVLAVVAVAGSLAAPQQQQQDLGSPIRIAQCRALCLDKVRKKKETHNLILCLLFDPMSSSSLPAVWLIEGHTVSAAGGAVDHFF